ncbi:MAG: hypothetical protein DSY47_07570 [Hydrogenothermus sp.]|nr:MAG: hypothetical protein DSY47_07570 [Hydrogenothermus sp.]
MGNNLGITNYTISRCIDSSLFKTGNVSIVLLDNKKGLPFIECSDSISNILKLPKSKLKGKNFIDFVKNKEKFLKKFSKLKKDKNKQVWEFNELSLIRNDNKEIFVDLKLSPIKEGEKIKAFWGYVSDISSLYDERNLFETISRVAPIGILMIKDEKPVFLNEKALEIFGYKEDEIKLITSVLQLVHPEERKKVEKLKDTIKKNSDGIIDDYVRIITKSGNIRWINFRATSIQYKNENYGLALIEDITNFVKLETFKNLLFNINKSLLSANSEEELLESIYLSVKDVPLIYAFSLIGRFNSKIENLYSFNLDIDKILSLDNIPEKEFIENKSLIYIKEIRRSKFNEEWKKYLLLKRINSCLFIPINYESQQYLISFYFEDINPLNKEDIEIFREIKDDIYFAFQHLKQERQLIINRYYDDITGVGNRNFFIEYIKSLKEKNVRFSVILIDVYHFKFINEKYGIEFGDKILRYIAKALYREVIDVDVFRTGFDEFALVIKSEDDINIIIRKAIGVLKNVFLDNITISLDYNVAVIRYPEDEKDISQLILKLERMLEVSKDKGKNVIQFFSEEMYEKLKISIVIEEELEKALREEELIPYFQPIVDVKENKIIGAEALIRWKRKDGTFVPPDEFIPIAEETGIINQIDLCMLLKAKELLEKAKDSKIKISVNITPSNIDEIIKFLKGEIVPICNIKTDYDFSKVIDRISLELTERKGIEVYESKEKISELKKLGFSISLDDFGKGYSSLNYLAYLEFDFLKIDMDFIHNLDRDEKVYKLVKSIINMARIFEVKTVAEGVETEFQLKILKKLGCDYYQGYLFSPPLSMEEFLEILQKQKDRGNFEK